MSRAFSVWVTFPVYWVAAVNNKCLWANEDAQIKPTFVKMGHSILVHHRKKWRFLAKYYSGWRETKVTVPVKSFPQQRYVRWWGSHHKIFQSFCCPLHVCSCMLLSDELMNCPGQSRLRYVKANASSAYACSTVWPRYVWPKRCVCRFYFFKFYNTFFTLEGYLKSSNARHIYTLVVSIFSEMSTALVNQQRI